MKAVVILPCILAMSIALPQGSNDCASPQALAGTGAFAFDNAGATQDGPTSVCSMERDVWFRWTAPSTGNVTVSTCGGTTVDTALAVYDGAGCPAADPLACGDDQCGLQSELVFSATAGSVYTVRVGTWAFAAQGGAGMLDISYGGTTGGCMDASQGPNVIAGDLDESRTWGDLGGVSAYSMAITACNVGDAELQWVGGNGSHPVVAHSLYRFENGRFEQLGTSWVKHGFAALQRDLCCTCIPSASISALGVGCSDPYSAALNGSQNGLGPPSEVDAFSGTYSWPPGVQSGVPPATTILDRRLQVRTDDMDPALHPTARYYVEAVYAGPDDAASGNGFDNASYRPYVRSGTTTLGAYDLVATGVTERRLPAIAEWLNQSATARVAEVRVPGEGAFWVGSDATDLGGSRWRYEVTVFNLNSSRPAAALAIPAGSAPASLGMGFPPAHSGDLRVNDPWPSQLASGRAIWVAPRYTSDPNANTVRWGTAFSFRFESGSPPVDRVATMVLAGSGNPSSISVPLLAPQDSGAPVTSTQCEAERNSGGTIGRILPTEFSGPARTLGLTTIGLPPGAVGYVLASRQSGFTPLAGGSSGNLCLGGAIGRYVGGGVRVAGAAGSFDVTVDLTAIPQPLGAEPVLPGETWNFQAWHRDLGPTGPTSNFSAALRARF